MRAKNMNLYRCFYEAFAFNLFWFDQTLPLDATFWRRYKIWRKNIDIIMRAKNMNLYRCFYEDFAFHFFWFNQTLPLNATFWRTYTKSAEPPNAAWLA